MTNLSIPQTLTTRFGTSSTILTSSFSQQIKQQAAHFTLLGHLVTASIHIKGDSSSYALQTLPSVI